MSDGAACPSRPTIAVLAWDVGHNPLGRAHVLAGLLSRRFDVEIWGAQFERFGRRVWAPLRDEGLPLRTYAGRALPGHLDDLERVAAEIDADALWVSKPRLPSLLLGVLAARLRPRPLVLDVDDHELAFVGARAGLDPRTVRRWWPPGDRITPFGETWTRVCESMAGTVADHLTVSNVALRERYGGTLVPHARDERWFDPAVHARAEARERLGLGPDDRLVLFGGTARAHKGVGAVVDAVARLGDRRVRLALIGSPELDELAPRFEGREQWILRLPPPRFSELPGIVVAADLACVLQDPAHPVTRYQMPAKVTDALAMGVPLLVTPTAPLAPLIAAGAVHVHDGTTPLHERIAAVLDDPDDARRRAERGRSVFLAEYSYEAVAPRVARFFDDLLAHPRPPSPDRAALVAAVRRTFPSAPRAPVLGAPTPRAPGSGRRSGGRPTQYDLVVFWRQNDTSLYGRRQDMLVEHLARTGRCRTVVHFDRPVAPEALLLWAGAALRHRDQGRLVLRETLARIAHLRDREGIHHRTHVYAGRRSRWLGFPSRSAYPEHVASVLRRHGVGERPTVFLVYPPADDLPAVLDRLAPDLVMADVVDDGRSWHAVGSPEREQVDRNYEEVLSRSDLVIANCRPVAERMQALVGSQVHVVPNACELPRPGPRSARPRELRAMVGPVVGYVGNLSSRLDQELLTAVVRARPEWNFVFVGSTHLDRSVLSLDEHAHVHFVGVRPYEEARRFVEHFDVGIVPHLDDEMTRSMQPLKAFVYLAAGVPVVATPVANLESLEGHVVTADGPEAFVAAIEAAIARGRRAPDPELLRPHSWEERVDRVLELVDEAMGVTPRR